MGHLASGRRIVTVKQAVCLVGGRGTRLGALTEQTPKPLLPVAGRPFLDYLVHEARRFGLQQLLLLTGYRSGDIAERYAGRSFGQLAVDVVVEPKPAGTAGALANAGDRLDDTFFLLNGDSFFDFNWLALSEALPRDDWTLHAALALGVVGTRYGRVELRGQRVHSFQAEGETTQPINAGVYLTRRTVLELIKTMPCSLEREILPGLAASGRLLGSAAAKTFIDIGLPDDFVRAQSVLPASMSRPAVFFDRDGVLNRDDGYVHRPDKFVWIDGALKAVRWLNDAGYYVFVVTNQGGVAHGYYGEQQVKELHTWMQDELQRHGAHIDAFEYCPYHPDGVVDHYRRISDFRKPAPGMLLKLLRDWTPAIDRSFMIGDRDTDVQAAKAAGIAGYKFDGGSLLDFVKRCARP
ncbi:MAG: HAD-IIIA family hydrolase [Alphaproteobacteria bacterium]|nr:HAD-IIIA family hydrolase [Alphaproteobacteria bacterium]